MRETFSIAELHIDLKYANRYAIEMDRDSKIRQLIGDPLTKEDAEIILKWLQSISDFDVYTDEDKPISKYKYLDDDDEDDD